MSVLVDTAVWSIAFRRPRTPSLPETRELEHLIREHEARLIGPIRQEVLSGIRAPSQFERLHATLEAFTDIPLETSDYVRAAEFFNTCRAVGRQGSNIDFLICSVAARENIPILTIDLDFTRFSRILPIRLHRPRTTTEPVV